MIQNCPCHSGQPYKKCCQPYHNGRVPATPMLLMRARYAAYALGKIGYIIQTEHKENRREAKEMVAWRKDLKFFCQNTRFMGLQILGEESLNEEQATVTFQAILMQAGKDASFIECSVFERVNGRWFYRKPLPGKAWGIHDPILPDSPR